MSDAIRIASKDPIEVKVLDLIHSESPHFTRCCFLSQELLEQRRMSNALPVISDESTIPGPTAHPPRFPELVRGLGKL